MIKDLMDIELNDLSHEGLDIQIIKKYIIKTSLHESFLIKNLSILLIKSGRFKLKLREKNQELSVHDIVVIPENSVCTLLEVHSNLQFFLISFSSEFAVKNCLRKELVDSFCFFIRKEVLKINLEEKEYQVLSLIYKLIYFVNKDAKQNGFDSELQRISFNLFLYELKLIYSKYSTDVELNFSRKESLVIQFFTILSIHCRKQHHVKFYAGALFITAGHLNKVVKYITGKPAKALIIEAIVIEAKSLLEDSQLTILEIAEELEFSSVSSFRNFFKKYTSFPPTLYRLNSIEKFRSR